MNNKLAYLNRVAKRAAKAAGLMKGPSVWKYWWVEGHMAKCGGEVTAYTSSEARSKIKYLLKIPSTAGIHLEKQDD